MKLDMECVRDILITLDEQTDFVKMRPDELAQLLPNYSTKQLIYTCLRLHEGNYINLRLLYPQQNSDPVLNFIGDLTFQGHEFLADIKPKSNWDKISPFLKQCGSASFETITSVAIALGTEFLKTNLCLTSTKSI